MDKKYKYPRPALAVDCVVFGLNDNNILEVLLICRNRDPFKDQWALPGGFVRTDTGQDESIESAARRELKEETGVEGIFLEQLYTFGTRHRDPREWVASVAH